MAPDTFQGNINRFQVFLIVQVASPATIQLWGLNNELWNFIMGQIQREVFARSFDWETVLDIDTLLSQAAVTIETVFIQFVATAKRVALSSVR